MTVQVPCRQFAAPLLLIGRRFFFLNSRRVGAEGSGEGGLYPSQVVVVAVAVQGDVAPLPAPVSTPGIKLQRVGRNYCKGDVELDKKTLKSGGKQEGG